MSINSYVLPTTLSYEWHIRNDDDRRNADFIDTVIAVSRERSKKKSTSNPSMGAYGISVAGLGHEYFMWGAGYARSQFPFIAFAIERLLKCNKDNQQLLIHAEYGLLKHIEPGGYIRKAIERNGLNSRGKPYEAFEPFAEITQSYDEGEWELLPYRIAQEPIEEYPGEKPFGIIPEERPLGCEKAELMSDIGFEIAKRYRKNLSAYKQCEILETDDIHDFSELGNEICG